MYARVRGQVIYFYSHKKLVKYTQLIRIGKYNFEYLRKINMIKAINLVYLLQDNMKYKQ